MPIWAGGRSHDLQQNQRRVNFVAQKRGSQFNGCTFGLRFFAVAVIPSGKQETPIAARVGTPVNLYAKVPTDAVVRVYRGSCIYSRIRVCISTVAHYIRSGIPVNLRN